jgi:hypothetical protein
VPGHPRTWQDLFAHEGSSQASSAKRQKGTQLTDYERVIFFGRLVTIKNIATAGTFEVKLAHEARDAPLAAASTAELPLQAAVLKVLPSLPGMGKVCVREMPGIRTFVGKLSD